MNDKIFKDILVEIRRYLAPQNIRVPNSGRERDIDWYAEKNQKNKTIKISAQVSIGNLCVNLQKDCASVPTFLLCIVYWYRQIHPDINVECHMKITGVEPLPMNEGVLHWRRSLFLLDEYSKCFSFFTYESENHGKWDWPTKPTLNSPSNNRKFGVPTKKINGRFTERAIESQIKDRYVEFPLGSDVLFPHEIFPQFPVGLFKESVKGGNEWTVAKTSEVDLWGASRNGKVLHLFELKGTDNRKVGIISEAFYYARLLGYVRGEYSPSKDLVIDCDNKKDTKWDGFEAAKAATKVIMWLIAPDDKYHPLVLSHGKSPIKMFNDALDLGHHNIEFRILPYILNDEIGFNGWRFDEMLPAGKVT
ncbi:MAG: hypothetical protein WC001_05920 [Desulfurivibrionaceae bacterium]